VNLAGNARDAMPNGGRLTIEVSNIDVDDEAAATHSGMTPGPYVLLAVSDTGHGMDAETMSRIFEPFFTTKDVGRGTGLGLATVYGIVNQSGGSIWVYSEPGEGTTFRIYIPRTGQAAEPAAIEPSEPVVFNGTETILVAEDEEILRQLIEVILGRLGYRVLLAPDSRAALEIGAREKVDLLLTDVVMPGQSGLDLAAAIRSSLPDLPVVYMSGYSAAALEDRSPIPADDTLLQKPFTPASLGRAVRLAIDRH
jgi:two-component system cell cycle sensor histidine kinase/response regulator CckA